jgi:hypothetical protein
MYANGLKRAVAQAVDTYDNQFFPGGQPSGSWPDSGGTSWVGVATEAYAEIFAFMSLVDPDPASRAAHGARARNLLMYVMNLAAQGEEDGAPFRDRAFSTYNRANYWGEAFGLTVDWAYPYFTADDKSTIRRVFLRWSDECVHASTTYEEHPQPIGVVNDPALLADTQQLRWAANNYFTGHMRNLTLMSLALDPTDDPPLDPGKPRAQLGNTLESYRDDVLGAWLYQQYAVYADAETASMALSAPAEGLGVASGGLSVEGLLYGESLGSLHEALFALHTAGYDDPRRVGPQAALVHAPYWDRFVEGFLHSITPVPASPTGDHAYLGPVYGVASYGDLLDAWVTPEYIAPFGSLGALDQTTGRADRLPALRWIAKNAIQGGADALYDRAARVWGNSYATYAILYFMLMDPAAPDPPDPRPALPLVFVDNALHRVLARTSWSGNATFFDYLGNWETINHQLGSANQFELWRKGEWLAKERSGYSNDLVAMTSDYHDTLAIQNDKPDDLQWFEAETSSRGGQWTNGTNAGDPTVVIGSGDGWVYAYGDATNLYNRPSLSGGAGALDVAHASRSIVWLAPDRVVVYDRATTKTDGRFKRWNLTVTAPPLVEGRTVVVTTPKNQRLTLQSLLPSAATITASPAEDFNRVAELEPTSHRIVIEDPSGPADVRFLHVLEAGDAGTQASPATRVDSTGGTRFQGAAVAGTVVMFPVDPAAPFTSTSWVAPAGATLKLVTGLPPGGRFAVTVEPCAQGTCVKVASGGDQAASAAGVLVAHP